MEHDHSLNYTDIKNYNDIKIFKDGYNQPLFYNDETKKYIKMEYEMRKTDWSLAETDNSFGNNIVS